MKQASLKLKTYAGNVNEVVHSDIRNKLVRGIFAYMGVMASLYVLFLGGMVFDIVERKALDAEARKVSSDVGNLELSYLSLSSSIDLQFSYARGFREADVKFATRKSLGVLTGSASLNSRQMINDEI